ncbi:hypothetical protein RF11_05957 [Thelohanellus kitauei]|uniref:Uncharacterized protein n=1 Tax=Thelohanellus kitauei TaxID=669202 RepID=A0A0C2MCV8_THEKT|nr:hypothetical protein RF11_05957 [Thelohanellus kitauei]
MAAYPFLKPNFFLFSPDNILTCTQNRFNFEDFGKKDDSAILDDSKKELRNIIKNLVQFYHRNDKNIALDDRLIIYFNGNLCFVQPKSVCYNHVDYDSIIFKIGGVFRLFLELPPHSIYQMINQKPLICGFISDAELAVEMSRSNVITDNLVLQNQSKFYNLMRFNNIMALRIVKYPHFDLKKRIIKYLGKGKSSNSIPNSPETLADRTVAYSEQTYFGIKVHETFLDSAWARVRTNNEIPDDFPKDSEQDESTLIRILDIFYTNILFENPNYTRYDDSVKLYFDVEPTVFSELKKTINVLAWELLSIPRFNSLNERFKTIH